MKSQTATEYLVITAVVIIIALIVVGSLGGIPGIGGGISEQAARAALSSQPVAITDYSVDTFKTVFTIRNNEPYMIRVDDVYIDGRRCWLQGGHSSPERFIQLR
ncbi:MAG: hypothetical protein ACMXYF_02745, partial [Candidatus Woesearchaeota archaeon]